MLKFKIHIKDKKQFLLLLKNSKNVSYMTFNTHPTIYETAIAAIVTWKSVRNQIICDETYLNLTIYLNEPTVLDDFILHACVSGLNIYDMSRGLNSSANILLKCRNSHNHLYLKALTCTNRADIIFF